MKEKELVMQQFTGTKTVKACRMSRKSAEEIIGRKVRPDSDEIEDECGYLVQYPDGYQSWSPMKVFEDAYRISESHIDRMIIEKEEVEDRYLKGRKFTFTKKFAALNEKQRDLLRIQLDKMESYLYTLCKRIDIEEDLLIDSIGNCCESVRPSLDPVGADGKPAEPLRSKHD